MALGWLIKLEKRSASAGCKH